jgi:pyridoxamine 5'-phosphate oxidase
MPALRRADLAQDPILQFERWFAEAAESAPLAEAMTLATVDAEGNPDARMVLLKGVDARGFRFFSNYESAKAGQLAAQPRAALILYWRELDRQVRMRGSVERLSQDESDEYFAGRPRESQLGAWASPQSRPVESREALDAELAAVERRFADGPVSRPPAWGGYLLEPRAIEFWQGRVGRLHDRFRYTRADAAWRIERLGP